jgi:hypothetical protein
MGIRLRELARDDDARTKLPESGQAFWVAAATAADEIAVRGV